MTSAGVRCPLCGEYASVEGHHFPGERISLGGSGIQLTQDAIILGEHLDGSCRPCPKRLISTTSLLTPERERVRQCGPVFSAGGYTSPPILDTTTGRYNVQSSRRP